MTRRLFTPGPVELSPAVVEAMSRQPVSHKSEAFIQLTRRVCSSLQWLFGTSQPMALLAGTGTTAIEAAITSLGVRNAPCLVLVQGRFGERLVSILTTHGAIVHTVSAEWGTAVTPAAVEESLATLPNLHSVWLVHSETSTGVTLHVQAIANVVHRLAPNAFLCVDAVTSVGIHELETDAWGLDAVMTGSQKGLCAPPGIGVVALSERARRHAELQQPVSTTLHLPTTINSLNTDGLFPWTPPVTIVAALQAALDEIRAEGRQACWSRHQRVAEALHDGLSHRGFHLFGNASSHAVTVVQHPTPDAIINGLLREFGITIAPGQNQLAPSVFRIGTCGGVSVSDVLHVLDALYHVHGSLTHQ